MGTRPHREWRAGGTGAALLSGTTAPLGERQFEREREDLMSQVFVFAIAFMVPAVIALYFLLARSHPAHAAAGCGVMAAHEPGARWILRQSPA